MESVAYTSPPNQHHKLVIAPDDGMANELVMPYLYGHTAREAIESLAAYPGAFSHPRHGHGSRANGRPLDTALAGMTLLSLHSARIHIPDIPTTEPDESHN